MGILKGLLKRLRWEKRIDDHTTMQPSGRDTFDYIEDGGYCMEVYVELMRRGKPDRVFSLNSVKSWKPPHEHEAISHERRSQIIAKVCQYLENNSVSYAVQGSDGDEALLEQLASTGIPVLPIMSLQQRKDQFDAMILDTLRTGNARIVIHGREISSPEEYLAIPDRHDGFVI
jgi:hypothetical protein